MFNRRFNLLSNSVNSNIGQSILKAFIIRSGFKTSDQVQGQGAGRSITRSPANGGMSMHLSEA